MSNHRDQAAAPSAAEAEALKSKALDLRIGGANYRQIAKALGISVSTAHDYVTSGLEELKNANEEATEELRRIEVARCDAMLMSLWPKRDQPRHADTILRIAERRARLKGLDAPMRWEGSGPGGGPIPVVSGSFDLSKLGVEELEQLERIIAVASPAPVAPLAAGPAPALAAAVAPTIVEAPAIDSSAG